MSKTVHIPRPARVETALIANAIATCARYGILVTQLDKPINDMHFLVTAPQFGLVAAYCTFSGVQDLIIRSAGSNVSMVQFGPEGKHKRYRHEHFRMLRMCNAFEPFAQERARVFYNDRRHTARDHRIPWKYYDAMQRGDRGALRT